jgi:exodeoxyribonuclease VII large subunit
LIDRAASVLSQRISYAESKIGILSSSAVLSSPDRFILQREKDLEVAQQRLNSLYAQACRQHAGELSTLVGRLEALSPLSVLSRGYAIAQGDDGVITSIEDVSVGERIRVKLNDGTVNATVVDLEKN